MKKQEKETGSWEEMMAGLTVARGSGLAKRRGRRSELGWWEGKFQGVWELGERCPLDLRLLHF